MSQNPIIERLLTIIEPVCIDAGCELVDLRLLMEQGGWVLRVCIDRPLPEGADLTAVRDERVDLAECEHVSRMLSAVLDVEDPVTQAYSLEVSSPGIDRPLRTAAHFKRYQGAEAKLQLTTPLVTPTGERRNFRGVLAGMGGVPGAERILMDVDGVRYELPLGDLDSARLVPDWDAVMRGGSGVSIPAPARGAKPGKDAAASTSKEAKVPKKSKAARTSTDPTSSSSASSSAASANFSPSSTPPSTHPSQSTDGARASSQNSKDAPVTGSR